MAKKINLKKIKKSILKNEAKRINAEGIQCANTFYQELNNEESNQHENMCYQEKDKAEGIQFSNSNYKEKDNADGNLCATARNQELQKTNKKSNKNGQNKVKKPIFAKLKGLFAIGFCLALLISSSAVVTKVSATNAISEEAPSIGYTVVVDPGHGGMDPGSIGRKSKVKEAEINLSISNKLVNYLKSVGITVVMTRTNENGLYGLYSANYKKRDMAKRKEIIQNVKPNMVISVHMNSFTNSKLRGAQVFYDKNSEISRDLALSIQKFFTAELPSSDKGVSIGDYFMLKCTEAPSVIAECGFLSNPEDEKLLLDDAYQDKVANCIYKGVMNFLNI